MSINLHDGELVIVDSAGDKLIVMKNYEEGGVLFETASGNLEHVVEVTEAELPELIAYLQHCLK